MRLTWKAGGIALVCTVMAGAGWAAMPALRPLGTLLPSLQQMVGTTRSILAETQSLQTGVQAVQQNLTYLDQQEVLLAEQEELMKALLVDLRHQQELAGSAGQKLTEILIAEQEAAVAMQHASAAGAETRETVLANAAQLRRMADKTAQIESGSRTIDAHMDRLNTELQLSADSFALVARIEEAIEETIDRSIGWWERLWRWFTQ